MGFAEDFYKDIFTFLRKEKVSNINQLLKVSPSIGYHGAQMISSTEYPWVKELFERFRYAAPQLIQPYLKTSSPRLFYNAPYSTGYALNSVYDWTVKDKIFALRSNYSCLFPKRIIYLSYQFKYWEEGYWENEDVFAIPLDFLAQLFALKPALTNGISLLLPQRISKRDAETDSNFEYWGTHRHRNEQGTISLEATGLGYDSLFKLQSDLNLSLMDSQIVKTPWILGGKLEHFVDLVHKNPDEFFLYSSAISHFFQSNSADDKALSQWIEELAIATKQLDVILKNKHRELTRKGIDVAVGTICTVVTLLLPDSYAPIKTTLSSLLGTKTTYDALTWIRDLTQAKEELSSDKYWILWRSLR